MRSRDAAQIGAELNAILASAGLEPLHPSVGVAFSEYLALILHWNSKINLTAIREQEGILRRHFLESIVCARKLPETVRTLLDFGSGAGLPGVPIALCRPEIAVTLAESQTKKAAFLREVVRSLKLNCTVVHGRAEQMQGEFDAVALRAVDRMQECVGAAKELVKPGGFLVLMTTAGDAAALASGAGHGISWEEPIEISSSEQQVIAIGWKPRTGAVFHVEH